MKRILKREYTAEFREQAVAMVNNGRSVPEVAQELGLITQTLRNWVKAAERGRLNEKAHKVSEEQMELSRLRVHEELRERGYRVGKARVERLMPTESFFNSLKNVLIHGRRYRTRAQVRADVLHLVATLS